MNEIRTKAEEYIKMVKFEKKFCRGECMMKHHKEKNIRYFKSYTDDFVESKNQSYQLPKNYLWVHDNIFYRMTSWFLYLLTALFAFLYCRLILHVKIQNRWVLHHSRNTGCFLYGNHTQPIGDAFLPVWVFSPKRIYGVASPANLAIPVLGPILPLIGALPLPDSMGGLRQLHEAICLRVAEKNCVVFYPEAHVWPWYTGIRPFPSASFGFPAECGAPSFCMTTTYQKRRFGKKPGITVYLDGPFYPDKSLSKREQKEKLHKEIFNCMTQHSRKSTCSYIHYEKEMS
ncbi:MAG: hypothetical protein QM793_03670 [Muricomes sp.]